jgi:8-oxo-dGTP pyrophosphatase MutT (NUDIX family)
MANDGKPGWLMKAMHVFSARNQLLQVAALPWRMRNGKVEVCLVTSRGTGRWILPKGWPERHLGHAEAAAVEAYEEAGLRGKADPEPCGSFSASKGVEPDLQLNVRLDVFLLPEPEQLEEFPEKGERKVKWMALEVAMETADEPGLKALLASLRQSGAFGQPAN